MQLESELDEVNREINKIKARIRIHKSLNRKWVIFVLQVNGVDIFNYDDDDANIK